MKHEAAHDTLLAALLAGEVDPQAREARALLAECDTCRESWSTLAPLVEGIAGVAHEQREVLAAAAKADAAPGLERIAPGLEELRAADRRARSKDSERGDDGERHDNRERGANPRPLRWIVAALAASVLIAIVWRLVASQQRVRHDDVLLHADDIIRIQPNEATRVFEVFEWGYPLPAGAYAELTILEPATAERVERELARKRVNGNKVSFTRSETEAWPDRIEWQVFVYGVGGELVRASARFSAQRSH